MDRACSRHEIEDECIQVLMGNSVRKRSLGRLRCRWEDSIKIKLEKWDGMSWTGLIWLMIGTSGRALVNTVMNLRVP
jgi:hypothetical protein